MDRHQGPLSISGYSNKHLSPPLPPLWTALRRQRQSSGLLLASLQHWGGPGWTSGPPTPCLPFFKRTVILVASPTCFTGTLALHPHNDLHEGAKAQRGEAMCLGSHSPQPSGARIQTSLPCLQSPHYFFKIYAFIGVREEGKG